MVGYQSALTQYRLNLASHFARVTPASRDDDICQRPVKRLAFRHQLFQGLLAASLLKQWSSLAGPSPFQLLPLHRVKLHQQYRGRKIQSVGNLSTISVDRLALRF